MSPTTQPVEPATTNTTATTQPNSIRKRRRRIAATGAADDCFTCQKRRIPCDRRRPYCTQCLEIGNDCSGYKTTLTWGVGVASRGKLRGLSLPVANSTRKASQDNQETKPQEKTSSRSSSISHKPTDTERTMKVEESNYYYGMTSPQSVMSPSFQSSYIPSAPIAIPSVSSQGWHVPVYHDHLEEYASPSSKAQHQMMGPSPLQRVASFSPGSYDDTLFSAPSTGSVGTFSDSDFPSPPQELPPTPEATPCADPYINNAMDLFLNGQDAVQLPQQLPFDGCSPFDMNSDSGINFNMDPFDTQNMGMFTMSPTTPVSAMSQLGMSPTAAPYISPARTPSVGSTSMAEELQSNQHSSWSTPVQSTIPISKYPNLSPRMAYLIDYYDKAVCPVLVAVDGQNNPYRVHVLALASTANPTLLNAVAALAANVLHHRSKSSENNYRMSPDPSQRGVCEEALYYKNTAVNLFNTAIRDPAAAHDDAILASLVVLSLFNISEGGIGKLKSQMPGIRQILALRGSNASQFLHWATYFFTQLDLMSAVVNDRRTQSRNSTLDLLDFSANLGALEHLANCEGRMLKVIARLGRAKFGSSWPTQAPSTPTINPFTGLPISSPQVKDFGSLDSIVNDVTSTDARQEFWSEWQHVRSRLRHWSRDSFSSPTTPSFPNGTKSENESLLVTHASEAFRHAALLFTERLAFPHIPPSSQQIQHLVSATLHHFSSIPESSALNKVLLWPLMVVGAECVQPRDRDVIRLRCGEAMRESGFFAGLSGLDILERVWAADDASWEPQAGLGWENKGHMPMLSSLGGQAGRWRRAMCMVDLRMVM
ncbi:hypothetical protein BT63DRAFT_473127 [Microthyrium microscopicum]|uniref:Zn(2)-C6 fungal-type domain-containing protein n=1 Tax=Microthyrium microscopicum TaxID=703497 RepID=A0A6A6U788_9PEZI|nr:hypothetical protein BT63DRAFT_473127 [Microthyrium microscopicum]